MRSPRASIVLALIAGGLACGRTAGEQTPDAGDAPAVFLESSPWLVTFAQPPTGPARLRAQRFASWKVESVLLEASMIQAPSWSPSGTWLAYATRSSAGGVDLWMRRLEGDIWKEAQLVMSRDDPGSLIGSMSWSPKSDQLLYVVQPGSQSVSVGVATPRADGSVALNRLDGSIGTKAQVSAEWSPTGDRVALSVRTDREQHISLHDVGQDARAAAPWPSRDLTPPSGTAFDTLQFDVDGAISSDGRWIVAAVTEQDTTSRESRTVRAFPTSGEGDVPELTACPNFRADASSEWCVPWSWHPTDALLLVIRRRSGAAETVEAWNPDSGSLVRVVADTDAARWLGPRGPRFLVRRPSNKTLAVVDVRDMSNPVVVTVPTTELPSFRQAVPSPDGRWLALEHHEIGSETSWIEAVDLRGEPPWSHREILRRPEKSSNHRLTWSPSNAYVLVDEVTDREDHKRGLRIELETGATTTIEYDLGPVPSSFYWRWDDRLAPDDRTVAIARDGAIALWPIGAPLSGAARFADTPDWAMPVWRPIHAP